MTAPDHHLFCNLPQIAGAAQLGPLRQPDAPSDASLEDLAGRLAALTACRSYATLLGDVASSTRSLEKLTRGVQAVHEQVRPASRLYVGRWLLYLRHCRCSCALPNASLRRCSYVYLVQMAFLKMCGGRGRLRLSCCSRAPSP